ncbi:MAG: DoxX family protein [Dermatophilaceae bacterium]
MSASAPARPTRRAGFTSVLVGVLRISVGFVFVLTGAMKFVIHAEEVALFERWGVPAAGLAVTGTGLIEILAGLALAAGVAMPVPAVLLAGTMVGALATAGRVDGGQHVVLPTVLLVLLTVVVAGRGGRWQPTRSLLRRGRGESTAAH